MSTTAATAITLGEVVIKSVSHTAKAVSFVSQGVSITSMSFMALNMAINVANVINTSITSSQAGTTGPGNPIGSSTRDNPSVIGTNAHRTLATFLQLQNITFGKQLETELILNSKKRPDIVDNGPSKTVWELKPGSWQASESYKNYKKGRGQLGDYVTEINAGGHPKLTGTFTAGGDIFDAPIVSGTTLPSLDGKYEFTYTIPNPASGMIFYSVLELIPVKRPVIDFVRDVKPKYGYPGAGIGNLISELIEKITGKKIPIPDPVISPIPIRSPAPIPAY